MFRFERAIGIFPIFIPFIIEYVVGLTFYAIFYKRFRDISLNDSVNFKTLYWIFIFILIWIIGLYAYVALLLLVFVYFGSRLGQA